jgi:hypothetical protein
VVRQLTSVAGNRKTDSRRTGLSQWRRTTGTFKLTIPVSTKSLMLEQEEQNLALMKWSNRAVAKTSRWHGIMQRYLDQLAGRVTFMGGDPSKIHASGTGLQKKKPTDPHKDRIFEGKIESVLYDGFNRFEYFTLKTVHDETKRFVSRDPYIEGVVLLAWLDDLTVLIITYANDKQVPEFIELSI